MLNKIISFSLHNRPVILFFSVLLMVVGIWTACKMEVDVFPDLNAPTVVVMTEAQGMASEEVERLVTFPIETAVNGATDVRRVRSSSTTGFSVVWVEFDWGTDIYRDRQIVSEKLATIGDALPQGVGQPTLGPQSSILGEVMFIGLTADSTSMGDLRTLADWTVRPQLLATGGVAQVTVMGGDIMEYQIRIHPERMRHYGVTLTQVMDATRNMNRNASGGVLYERGNEYIVRGVLTTANTELLGQAVVATTAKGQPVVLADVADVEMGVKSPKMGLASVSGKPAVLLTVTKQPSTSTLELTGKLDEVVEQMRSALPKDVKVNTQLYRQQNFIDSSISNIKKSLVEGGIFVVLVLFIFLMNARTTVISLVTIPLSLLITMLVLHVMGLTINTMSIGGMAIAIGSLVDDAIVDVENVFKRLRQNARLPKEQRQSKLDVIFHASREVRMPILNSTLIIVVSFVPLFFLSGLEGRMLAPLGVSFIVSLFASTVVALTLTPVLCSYLLKDAGESEEGRGKSEEFNSLSLENEGGRVKSEEFNSLSLESEEGRGKSEEFNGDSPHGSGSQEPRWVRAMKVRYEQLLMRVLDGPKRAFLIATGVLVVLTLVLFFNLGRSFLPSFNEGSFTINVSTLPGVSFEESDRMGEQAERLLLQVPEVKDVARKTGRAELDEHALGVNTSEMEVPFELKDRSKEEVMADIRSKLRTLPGVNVEIGQPISHRIDAMLSGTKAGIAIKVFGPDLTTLHSIGLQIQQATRSIDGVTDLNVEQQVERPQLVIRPRRLLLASNGITLPQFAAYVNAALGGEVVSQVQDGGKTFDLTVRMADEDINSIDHIRNMLIDTADGRQVCLSDVADIFSSAGPNTISRENAQRKLVVSANAQGRDLRSVVNDMRQAIETNVKLPDGYRIEYGGQFESEASASRLLLGLSVVSIVVILLLLYLQFRSWKQSVVVLLNLPLALIGGVLALVVTGGVVSIPAIIGFISLFGMATRGGMLLVDRYNELARHGLSRREVVLRGSLDRLLPILMTALSSGLALIPLALGSSLPGNEIQSPMAQVMLGGLLTSTLLNLIIVPLMAPLKVKETGD
ncbi:MAG: efflux RND transporter permease subunit [Prevotella sp.]|nr:efflux RND transporter permease subunit [Prevotella sp.]